MNPLEQALMLMREAVISLAEIAAKAGDVPEWNEGGSYYTLLADMREFLKEHTKPAV